MAKNKNLVKANGDVVAIPASDQPIGPHTLLGVDASVDEQRVHPGDDPLADEIAALEAAFEVDPQMAAAEQAEAYNLTPGAKSLLDRSIDSLATSDGNSIEDPDFKQSIRSRAALLNATGNDLAVAISCIVDAMASDPKSIAGTVYSLCYSVLKQAVFFANLDMRRYLDPRGDFDLTIYRHANVGEDYNPQAVLEALGTDFAADAREERRTPPAGCDSELEREWAYYSAVYGADVETTEDIFGASLSDLRTYLQLLTEAFGWDAQSPMAYANVMNPDGTFTPIHDAATALDHQEVMGKERRKVKQAKQASAMLLAASIAAERLTNAARRTK